MGRDVVITITDGNLDFDPCEQIFYGEFDGRARKRVLIKIIGEWKNLPGLCQDTIQYIYLYSCFASIYAWEFGFNRSNMKFGEISKW